MDAKAQSTSADLWRESPQWQQAYIRQQAETIGFWWQSPRAVAQQLGHPDSSLRYCLRLHRQRCQDSRWPQRVVHFLDSPDGIEFLHHRHVALHLVFGQANDCGLRALSWFLKLSGLDEFLPASYGALQAFAVHLETSLAEQAACQEQCPLTTHVAELQQQIEQAVIAEAGAQQQRAACQQRQQQATKARQALSHDYHPIALETGQPLEAEEVLRRLSGHFDRLDEMAKEVGLSESARQRLAKARRVLDPMIATMVFFGRTVAQRLASRDLPPDVSTWLREQLIPGGDHHLPSARCNADVAQYDVAFAGGPVEGVATPSGNCSILPATQRFSPPFAHKNDPRAAQTVRHQPRKTALLQTAG